MGPRFSVPAIKSPPIHPNTSVSPITNGIEISIIFFGSFVLLTFYRLEKESASLIQVGIHHGTAQMGMSDCGENGRSGSSEEKDEAEGVRREKPLRACDLCLGVHIQRQVFIYICIFFHRGGEGVGGGCVGEVSLAPSLVFLQQSTVPVRCHDDQHFAFAHLFERGRQRDQVGVGLVTSFPQVQEHTCRAWLCRKVVQVPADKGRAGKL